MRMLMRAVGVGALLMASACTVQTYTRPVYRYGYGGTGGSGPDLLLAQDVCQRAALRHGWRWLRADSADVTGPSSARVHFQAEGIPFRTDVTCFYDSQANTVTLR